MSSIMFSAFSAFVCLPNLYRTSLCWYGIYGSDFFFFSPFFPGPVTQTQQELWKGYAAVWVENKQVRSCAASVKKAQQVVCVCDCDCLGWQCGLSRGTEDHALKTVWEAWPVSLSGISALLFPFVSLSLFYYHTRILAPDVVMGY